MILKSHSWHSCAAVSFSRSLTGGLTSYFMINAIWEALLLWIDQISSKSSKTSYAPGECFEWKLYVGLGVWLNGFKILKKVVGKTEVDYFFEGLLRIGFDVAILPKIPHDYVPMYERALMIWASYVFEWSKFSLTKSGRIFFFPFLFDFKVSKGYESLVLLFPTICSLLLRKSCEMTRKCQLGTWTDALVAK